MNTLSATASRIGVRHTLLPVNSTISCSAKPPPVPALSRKYQVPDLPGRRPGSLRLTAKPHTPKRSAKRTSVIVRSRHRSRQHHGPQHPVGTDSQNKQVEREVESTTPNSPPTQARQVAQTENDLEFEEEKKQSWIETMKARAFWVLRTLGTVID
eukprot:TRINITY_DN11508_c0_g1_i1.p1 TRINITY_DN11508_c0_g1~~TRINITY_DN11508_c0_g1_i1.p1  ORF type:complete len:155 (+),score=10.79 TRINITY_DN11508_c0_g1_i1:102-566(+)